MTAHIQANALPTLNKVTSNLFVTYDNPSAMFADLDGTQAASFTAQDMGGSFTSNVRWRDLPDLLVNGLPEQAQEARALAARINAAAPATIKRKRVSRPFGRAVTAAYLASDPTPCRARVKLPSNRAPLSVFVNCTSSAAVGADELTKRGVAIAALMQRLAGLRPVNLYIGGAAKTPVSKTAVVWACKFPTAPLDLYRLAFLTANQGFARGLGFAAVRNVQTYAARVGVHAGDGSRSGSIVWAGGYGQKYENEAQGGLYSDLKAALGTEVYYIPAAGVFSPEIAQMLNNPVEWINETVARLT